MIEFHSYNYDSNHTDLDFRGKTVFWHDCMNQDEAEQIFNRHGIPDTLINSAHPESPWAKHCQYFYFPSFLNAVRQSISGHQEFEANTTHCFNFTINNATNNRILLMKLVEYYQFNSYLYTWSGAGKYTKFDYPSTLEHSSELKEFIQHPVNHQANFQTTQGPVDLSNTLFNVVAEARGTWLNNWNQFIGRKMSSTAVSLITETDKHFDTINFTEKTLFSVIALTFPIWIGGKHQAKNWASLGFDTYSDIVNHDYQYADTLLDRTVIALESNRKLLEDLDYAKFVREQNMGRLIHNRSAMADTIIKMHNQHYWTIHDYLQGNDRNYFKTNWGPVLNT